MKWFVGATTLVIATAMAAASCRRPASVVDDLEASWRLTPATPIAGQPSVIDLTLRQPDGSPVVDARLSFEGHMTHPGMAPLVIPLTQAGGGRYRAGITPAMSGDWVIFVTGELGDGRPVRQRIATLAVRAAE